jgi:CspA family cold shock protein
VTSRQRRTNKVQTARVREWQDEEGWGVLDSEQTSGGWWAHYSHIEGSGYRTLKAGQVVQLEWESARQDGNLFRATRVIP